VQLLGVSGVIWIFAFMYDGCGNQLYTAYSGRPGSAVVSDSMRFTCEFIVSWVDFGVNPLAVSQSLIENGVCLFRFCDETLKKAF
jgi:hypothetical protein